MRCSQCDARVLMTRGLDGYEWWCPAHGEVTDRRPPTEADQPRFHAVPRMTMGTGTGKWWVG